MHGPVWTVLPEDGIAQGESSALLCTTCGVACVVVDARGNLFSRCWERLRAGRSLAFACPAPALDTCESVPRCRFLLAPEGTRMYYCVFVESESSPLCQKYRTRRRFRGDHEPKRTRMREPCGSAELFTVDKRKTRGKITPIQDSASASVLHLPQNSLGQTGILPRREDEQS